MVKPLLTTIVPGFSPVKNHIKPLIFVDELMSFWLETYARLDQNLHLIGAT
jgi:hypothetical protein